MIINIPDKALADAQIAPNDLIIDFVIYLYDKKILSSGQARKIAGLDVIAFQQELAKRDVYIHFGMNDLENDLKNLGLC